MLCWLGLPDAAAEVLCLLSYVLETAIWLGMSALLAGVCPLDAAADASWVADDGTAPPQSLLAILTLDADAHEQLVCCSV